MSASCSSIQLRDYTLMGNGGGGGGDPLSHT